MSTPTPPSAASAAATSRYEQFQAYRSKMNCRVLGEDDARAKVGALRADGAVAPGGTLVTKRFFRLDGQTYEPGALDAKTKELLGLVASLVLRCDDCVAYHVDQCVKAGCTDEELWETFDVGLIVGGSIVIPHLRRGVEFLDQARAAMAQGNSGAPCPAHG
jgi:AhpD family alkylhydroperoxidase